MLRSQRREIARTDVFGQLGMRNQSAAKCLCADSKSEAAGSRNLSNALFFVFATTCALHFLSQEIFLGEIENKIHFFLVVFATDF